MFEYGFDELEIVYVGFDSCNQQYRKTKTNIDFMKPYQDT